MTRVKMYPDPENPLTFYSAIFMFIKISESNQIQSNLIHFLSLFLIFGSHFFFSDDPRRLLSMFDPFLVTHFRSQIFLRKRKKKKNSINFIISVARKVFVKSPQSIRAGNSLIKWENMSLGVAEDDSGTDIIHLPADVNWEMLDKSKFFFLGAALFSGVSATLYPTVVLKTRQQLVVQNTPCFKMAVSILKHDGFRGFYRGFGTSLMGTIPARALYMGALEMSKSSVACATTNMGFSEAKGAAIANAAAGVTAAMAAQLVWTPIDVVSQRLMVQGGNVGFKYNGGIDAFRKIVLTDGIRGLYRGFGISALTYAPSNAVWWASYSIAHRAIWDGINYHFKKDGNDSKAAVVAVQAASATIASGVSALVTMPLDTIKTRLQVLDGEGYNGKQTLKKLMNEGGLSACYRGLGPRWVSMSMSATTMITTYEFLKKLSTKNQHSYGSLQ